MLPLLCAFSHKVIQYFPFVKILEGITCLQFQPSYFLQTVAPLMSAQSSTNKYKLDSTWKRTPLYHLLLSYNLFLLTSVISWKIIYEHKQKHCSHNSFEILNLKNRKEKQYNFAGMLSLLFTVHFLPEPFCSKAVSISLCVGESWP